MNFLKKVLLESRESDFRTKFGNKFSQENLDEIVRLSKLVPNGSKFLNFLGNSLPDELTDEVFEDTKQLLKKFVSVGPNLERTDINQYVDLQDLRNELKKHENRIRRQVQAIEGASLVYEDNRFTVVNPITYQASCYYGAGTKWCTSSESTPSYFVDKNKEGKLFYIIDKTLPSSDKFYKVALLQGYDGSQEFFDAPDKTFKTGWILGTPEYEKIQLAIDSYMQDNFSKQIEIFADKERAEKERKRLEAQRMAEIEREKLLVAQERREDGDWDEDLIEDPDSIAARAHAFFQYCIDMGEDELTPEIRLMLRESKIELENINRMIEQTTDEEKLEELNDRKIAREEMMEEYSTYIDVYNCIPEGSYYNLTKFTLVGGNGSIGPDEEYACSTYDKAYESAKEYVQQLLDDIGLEGFNKGFVNGYIDDDAANDYIRDFYSEDVYNNPESYLDESQRELSYSQEQKILELEKEWEDLNEEESETEDEDRIQEISDRIDEIKYEIDEIRENPDGDFDEDALENEIDSLAYQYRDNIQDFYSDMFGDNNFTDFLIRNYMINMNDLIEGAVDADGIGHNLGTYDGSHEEVTFMGETYVVVRIE